MLGADVTRCTRPDEALRARLLLRRSGPTPSAAYAIAAMRAPHATALIDERGTLTFREVHERSGRLAGALRDRGIDHTSTVAIMCQNHRGLLEASVACTSLAADIVHLDPACSAGVLAETLRSTGADLLIHDEEHSPLLECSRGPARLIAWSDPGRAPRHTTLEQLIASVPAGHAPVRTAVGQSTVTVTSHGCPDHAAVCRRLSGSLISPAAACSRIPLRRGEPTVIAAPLSSLWGHLHLMLALRHSSTIILQRHFDPIETLAATQRHHATALALTPDMLSQITRLPGDTIAWYRSAQLRIIAVRGAELPGVVALPALEHFGDVLYNLRGRSVVRIETGWPWPAPALVRAV